MFKIHTKTRIFLNVLLALLAFPAVTTATNITAGPINVSAEIPSGLALELTIIDQLTGAIVPSMDFGELARFNDEYRATRFFDVLLKVNTAGNAYELTQLSTPLTLTSGSETIPNGAFFVKPFYDAADNAGNALPTGATLGVAGSAVTTQSVYKDPTGSARIVRLQYTLTGDPMTGATQPILVGQKSGSYRATVLYTLTTT